jgi:hypothetical protein
MLPVIIVVFATYHYMCRLFAKKKMSDKCTQTEIPWLFYSELVSDDYTETDSYDSLLFNMDLDEDVMVVDSPPASDWSVNEDIPDVVVRQLDL